MVGPSREVLMREAQFENQLWHMIRQTAISDPALKEMLDQVKGFYLLKYSGTHNDPLSKIYAGGGTGSSTTGSSATVSNKTPWKY